MYTGMLTLNHVHCFSALSVRYESCRVFQEMGGSFSNQMYTQEFPKGGQATDGTELVEASRIWLFGNERRHDPKAGLLKVERGEHILYVSHKARNVLLRQGEKYLRRHSVRARLSLL